MYLFRDVNVDIYLVKAHVATSRRGDSGHRVIYISEYTTGGLIGGLRTPEIVESSDGPIRRAA